MTSQESELKVTPSPTLLFLHFFTILCPPSSLDVAFFSYASSSTILLHKLSLSSISSHFILLTLLLLSFSELPYIIFCFFFCAFCFLLLTAANSGKTSSVLAMAASITRSATRAGEVNIFFLFTFLIVYFLSWKITRPWLSVSQGQQLGFLERQLFLIFTFLVGYFLS